MAKVRIHSWAKENGKSSIEVVKKLNASGHNVRNQTMPVEESVLNGLYKDGNSSKPAAKENKPTSAQSTDKAERPTTNNNGGYQGNNNNGERRQYNNNNNGERRQYNNNNNGERRQYNNNNGGYQGNNNNGERRQYNNNNGGYRGNNNGGQGGYRGNNNGGYQGNNNGGQGGYRGNQGGQGGYRGNNNGPAKTEGASAVEQKPTNNKRRTNTRKPNTFDKFKQFDRNRENNRAFDGKTKTQIKKEAREERKEALKKETKVVKWSDDMTVSALGTEMGIPATDIVMKLFELGIMATMNQAIDLETAEIIATDYNIEFAEDDSNADLEFETLFPEFSEEETESRPPIVTIMGHVDHGKTTLLDTLRNANVTAKEAGGITQHIGAYQIDKDGFKVTFLDTPGHAAFTAMRARGANVTDITILVVAADDGVMPQTKEAVAHAKEAKSPLIVAVNKMDKPDANPDRVMSELAELGVLSEEWGGETPFVKISALKGEGLDELIDYIKVITDIHEFKAPYNTAGFGTVIEANLDKGRGPVATILMQGGHMSLSDNIVIGDTWGSIRVMQDEYGKRHKKIGPSMPVEITGLKDVPQAGDQFVIMEDAKQAQAIGEKRASIKAQKDRNSAHALSLEELNAKIAEGDIAELPVIIKADVQGSVEALAASLEKIDVNGVKVRVVQKGVGGINESDVLLATASNAIMIGFNVRPDANTRKIIEKEKIELMVDNVIYNIIEKIEDAMNGMRATKTIETIVGYAAVQEVFKITGVGKVAGAIVSSGKILRSGKLRLIREGVVIYDGEIGQLKRFKDDAKEVIEGQDFGISFKNFEDIKKGDELECYEEATEII
ncbi:translation initiation factor IF-2 [Mollicutes bacterium LVI A0078]|nr:translation initiation factor IF-2 [Mollicutes bacterium LVI A0078]